MNCEANLVWFQIFLNLVRLLFPNLTAVGDAVIEPKPPDWAQKLKKANFSFTWHLGIIVSGSILLFRHTSIVPYAWIISTCGLCWLCPGIDLASSGIRKTGVGDISIILPALKRSAVVMGSPMPRVKCDFRHWAWWLLRSAALGRFSYHPGRRREDRVYVRSSWRPAAPQTTTYPARGAKWICVIEHLYGSNVYFV